jgi:hypothetical protein
MAAVTRGSRARGANAMRLTLASLIAVALRIGGYGLQGPAVNHPILCVFFYLIPLIGAAGALALLMGADPVRWFRVMTAAEAAS